jgi:hypothetical protein
MTSRTPSKLSLGRGLAGMFAMLLLAFGLGVILGTQSTPGEMVWITEEVGFSPHDDPLLNGFYWVGIVVSFTLVIGLGSGAIGLLIRYGIFWEGTGAMMLLMALTALILCLFGAPLGLEFETGQQVVFTLIALVFGALGLGMLRNALRQRRENPNSADENQA